jgi:uncharacterized hydantoinase/oxoprolinase family protein
MFGKKQIDFEKALVIFRKGGKFSHFHWHEKYIEEINETIKKYNMREYNAGTGRSVEVCTDGLVREICAYREKTKPFNSLEETYKGAQKDISETLHILENVVDDLREIYNPSWDMLHE